ncbi:MAG TPA: response regulator transcription factor [Saprospiraceae bacterium]|nr:response regulator transcription factor [Saprospiraceae bacterium]
MKAETITVHIADDHKILIDGIVAVLKTEDKIDVVGYSLDGIEVVDWFKKNNAEILVLDIGMPKLDGIEVLRSLQTYKNPPKTIVLTSYNDVKLIKEVLKMGAKGFITKVSAGESIIEAIKTVHGDDMYFSSDIRNKIVNSFTGRKVTNELHFSKYFGMLSDREYEILKLIAEEYTNKEIADTLNISAGTVETHKKNIMAKLGVKNAVGLAIYVVKHKLIE